MNRKPKRATAKPEVDAMLRELANGASKIFQNAVDLYHEALALHGMGAHSRALFLHQISLEECAKIEMLGAWAVSVLMDMETSIQKLTLAFASHKAKNYTNAYLLPLTKAESDARRERRWDKAAKAFKQQQADFHTQSNSAKNGSLYVDIQNFTFTSPRDRITEPMVRNIAEANGEFLAGARGKVEMMRRWLHDTSKVRGGLMKWFESRLKELKTQSDDPEKAISVSMEEIVTRAEETGYSKAMMEARQAIGD